jgi:hypothetical protein
MLKYNLLADCTLEVLGKALILIAGGLPCVQKPCHLLCRNHADMKFDESN